MEKRKGEALLNLKERIEWKFFKGFGFKVEDIRYERLVTRFEK